MTPYGVTRNSPIIYPILGWVLIKKFKSVDFSERQYEQDVRLIS